MACGCGLNNPRNTYGLAIYFDKNKVDNEIIKLYEIACNQRRELVSEWARSQVDSPTMKSPQPSQYIDSGFDLFTPNKTTVNPGLSVKLNMGINCSMTFNNENGINEPCGYYLYPRSSMGSKTPLRLSNSIGLIDSGYRGDLIAVVDNLGGTYEVTKGMRLVQICPSDLRYPIYPCIVTSEEMLSFKTTRGKGGFGSTGR